MNIHISPPIGMTLKCPIGKICNRKNNQYKQYPILYSSAFDLFIKLLKAIYNNYLKTFCLSEN